MKILYVITKSNWGGAQKYVYDLATTMGSDFTVAVASGGEGLLNEKLREKNVRTIAVKGLERNIGLIKEFKAFFELISLFNAEAPDVVHLNSSKAGALGALAARFAGVPRIIFTAHGWPFLERRNILWRTIAYFASWVTSLLSHEVIVLSKRDQSATRHIPGWKDKTTVIHLGIPPIEFLPRESARGLHTLSHNDDVWLVANAELHPNKNLKRAIEAVQSFNSTAAKKVFFTIIGEGELKDALKTDDAQISFLGFVPDAAKHLKGFDMSILPSLKEGTPYVLLEAGLAAHATIASNVGGIPEIIQDGFSGTLIDPKDTKSIEKALESYVNSPALREAHGAALKTHVEREFSMEDFLMRTKRTYLE